MASPSSSPEPAEAPGLRLGWSASSPENQRSRVEPSLQNFHVLDRKFRKACLQIRLLNDRIEDLQVRYDRAYKAGRRSFRYTYRLQLATLEGLRNVCYEYACRRADELEEMQRDLIAMGVISDSSDAETNEDDPEMPEISFDAWDDEDEIEEGQEEGGSETTNTAVSSNQTWGYILMLHGQLRLQKTI